MNDKTLRKELIELLKGGQAHSTLEEVLRNLKPELCNKQPQKGVCSVYEELEHLSVAQEDILNIHWILPGNLLNGRMNTGHPRT